MGTGPPSDSENREDFESRGNPDDSTGPDGDHPEPGDCPTCGYPGCDNECVCDICGFGPNAHAENCVELLMDRILDDNPAGEPDELDELSE